MTVPPDIVAAFTPTGLLRASRRDALIAEIAAGTMKGDDWKVEIELASAKAANE